MILASLKARIAAPSRFAAAAAVACLASLPAAAHAAAEAPASTPAPDKSGFSLLNPTPRDLMRPMSTDRPDSTESPYTVDAGHIQVEASFVEYARDTRTPDRSQSESLDVLPTNLKLGLLNNVDLQFVLTPYTHERTHDAAGAAETAEGFPDPLVRLKINLWGNDSGDTALALMPFIKVPGGDHEVGNGHVEGGLIIPLGLTLPADFSLTVMVEFDAVYDPEGAAGDNTGGGYYLDFVHTASLGHDLVGDLAGFIEYVGVVGTHGSPGYRASFDAGLTYALTPDIQFDVAVNFGLTRPAEDLRVLAGISIRY
ncbi:MAG: transporter [Planctomycetota bacterium]|nr:transporter [Planctomycetota bacterium]